MIFRIPNIPKILAFEELKESFYQENFEEISSEPRTYAKLKTVGMEEYFHTVENVWDEHTTAQYHSHDWERKGLLENQRLCPFSNNKVETEQHFIMECSTFEIFRQKLSWIKVNDRFGRLNHTEKFVSLLSNSEVKKIISTKSFTKLQVRTDLVENHK